MTRMCSCLSYDARTCSFVRDTPRICLRQTLGRYARLAAVSPLGGVSYTQSRDWYLARLRSTSKMVVFGLKT